MSGETEAQPSAWVPDLLKDHLDTQIDDLKNLLNERFIAQQRAVDAALAAAEKAVDKALAAAETAVNKQTTHLDKEFHEHLMQQRHETDLAFLAADKAIDKALEAINKRLEGMNEFRAQLSAQQSTFMPRELADAQIAELRKQLSELTSRADSMAALAAQGQRNLTIYLTVAAIFISIVVLIANNVFR